LLQTYQIRQISPAVRTPEHQEFGKATATGASPDNAPARPHHHAWLCLPAGTVPTQHCQGVMPITAAWGCDTESQNHRMVGVGRDLCGSPSPAFLNRRLKAFSFLPEGSAGKRAREKPLTVAAAWAVARGPEGNILSCSCQNHEA